MTKIMSWIKILTGFVKPFAVRLKISGEVLLVLSPWNDHLDTATSYGNIGQAWSKKGDYTKALEYHMKCVAIFLATLGENHPDTATSYNNIGLAWSKKGDYTKALEYDMKSLPIYLANIGQAWWVSHIMSIIIRKTKYTFQC